MLVRMVIDFPDDLIKEIESVLVVPNTSYVKGFILDATRTKVKICKSANERADRKKVVK